MPGVRDTTAWIALALLGSFAALGCGGGGVCDHLVTCDIREPSCARDVLRWVSCTRGGSVAQPAMQVISQDEYLQRVAPDMSDDAAQAKAASWNAGLAQFRLAPAEYDPSAQQMAAASEIAAVYFSSDHTIAVIDRGDPMDSAAAVSTLAHEFVHALQDHELGLPDFQTRWGDNYDASLAIRGLVEGEAVHYQVLAAIDLEGHAPDELFWEPYYNELRNQAQRDADRDPAPVSMARTRFPYAFGGAFVSQAWLAHGRSGIDALFEHPPRATRELMFDDDGADRASDVRDVRQHGRPDLGADFELQDFATLGAWIARMYGARINVAVIDRWLHAQQLTGDAFSVQRDPLSGRTIASWHVRTLGPNASSWPGVDQLAFVNTWVTNGDADLYAIAGAPGLPPRAETLQWNELEDMVVMPPMASETLDVALDPAEYVVACSAALPDVRPFLARSAR